MLYLERPAESITSVTEFWGDPYTETETVLDPADYRLLYGGRALGRLATGSHSRIWWSGRVVITYRPIDDSAAAAAHLHRPGEAGPSLQRDEGGRRRRRPRVRLRRLHPGAQQPARRARAVGGLRVSARAQMVHRCALERDAAHGTPDGYGLPSAADWQPLLRANVPCCLWSTAERELIGAEKSEVIEDLRMLVPNWHRRDRAGPGERRHGPPRQPGSARARWASRR